MQQDVLPDPTAPNTAVPACNPLRGTASQPGRSEGPGWVRRCVSPITTCGPPLDGQGGSASRFLFLGSRSKSSPPITTTIRTAQYGATVQQLT